MFQFFIQNKKKCGFTLIETLVAVSIFTFSILALINILSIGLANTSYVKNKLIASYLSQEGMEYIRNMRDTFVLYEGNTNGWNDFINKMSACDRILGLSCYFDDEKDELEDPYDIFATTQKPITHILVKSCTSNVCPYLLYNSLNGKYGYNSGVATSFIRKIEVQNIDTKEIEITSTVYWASGSGVKSISLTENLFNWTR